ncbi:TRAP transporter small permease subunit [Variovorax sp. J2P1-59]|uniref:TRAP transporter small permease n=1 Tax=Variovorax flavidus TaxID=3053501 RepID=UPI002577F147|nr:TRAP transporter small permease subunit [Variovorax sp. J2P1-59]MDM0076173.1 TRAP transporter small permease subunit [Variovorax sp. J2P1-59]
MAILQTIDRCIGAACRGVLYLTLAVVFAILSANVALRYVAGTSLASASELPELMFPWLIMAGVVLAAQHGSHIAVVLLTQKLGAARRWVLAGGSIAVAVLYLSLTVAAWPLAEIAADERSPMLQVPGSVSVWALMLGFTLLSIVTLCKLPEIWADATVAEPEAAEALAHGA